MSFVYGCRNTHRRLRKGTSQHIRCVYCVHCVQRLETSLETVTLKLICVHCVYI